MSAEPERVCNECGAAVGGRVCSLCEHHTALDDGELCRYCQGLMIRVEQLCASVGCTCHPLVSTRGGSVSVTHEDRCRYTMRRVRRWN